MGYSNDLRVRVIEVVKVARGPGGGKTAKQFVIGGFNGDPLVKARARQTGSFEAKSNKGSEPVAVEEA